MDRAAIWPDFRPEWICREDDELVFVDKPCGISSQSAEPNEPDDIVTRYARFRTSRGEDDYVGVHQRLDQDTSGVMVFAKKREANAMLAEAFEKRRAKKVYLACVENFRGEGGEMNDTIEGKPARSRVRVVSRRASRALLEVTIETGRTHQIRIQLEKRRTPIAGDAIYGGPAAPRLMLHAASLSLPLGKSRDVTVTAKTPIEMTEWLARGALGEKIYDDAAALDRALHLAIERRFKLGRGARTNAFRLVNEEGDALPRLAVDVYDAWLVAQLYGEPTNAGARGGPWEDAARRERVLDALGRLGFDGVYLKVRPKQANELKDTRREDLAPKLPVRGESAPDPIVIRENDMPIEARLGDGLSTGVFLDQRQNRELVRRLSGGKSVVNLFSYACAFTVAAAFGGASKTVSVDAAPVALEQGMKNVALAEGALDRKRHTFVAIDAFSWLAREERRGTKFDFAILDPPSYSNTKKHRFSAASDYAELLASVMRIVAPGGQILACCNHRGIARARFRKMVFEAGRIASRDIAQAKDLPDPRDYPVAPGGESHLKSVLVTLRN